jgi:hypothetical protein
LQRSLPLLPFAKNTLLFTQQRNRAENPEEGKEAEARNRPREAGAGSVLFSMNTEASADLHRSPLHRAIGWRARAGPGSGAELAREPRPRRGPAPSPRACCSASCKWRAPRQMRSSGSGGCSRGGSWHLPLPLSRGSRGT